MTDIVVSGGAGLQGSKLARRLSEQGHSVTAIDNCVRGCWANLDSAPKVKRMVIDLTNPSEGLFEGVETVFHLAADIAGIDYTKRHDGQIMLDNLVIDANVVKAAKEARVKNFIFASSACAYPTHYQTRPDAILDETMMDFSGLPELGYGWAKLTTELLLSKMQDMNVGILRLFNVYGPGEDYGQGSHAIAEFIRKALSDEPFTVHGDGEQTRSCIYVEDVVDAYLAVYEKGLNAGPFNIGSDRAMKISDLARLILKLAGKDKPLIFEPDSHYTGVMGRTADASRAKRLLGWTPKTELETGLERTIEYVKAQRLAPVAGVR